MLRFAPGLDPKVQWCRDVIDRQVGHMAALLEDLLDVSRLTRDMIVLRRDQVEIGTAIAQAVEITRPLIDSRGHELFVDLPSDPIEVDGDLTRLTQIFGNLLSNAAKYTDPGGRITLVASRGEREVVVRVKDSGIGINPAQLSGIFDLFSQVDPARERSQGGLGIGLALAKRLVDKHGGAITAISEGLGSGAEFIVTLPTVNMGIHQSFRLERNTPTDGSAAVHPAYRVVVVDDNVDAADSLAMMLRMQGYEVRTACDGQGAIDLVREFDPQLVLLDLGMPRMNGYDVAVRLRSEPGGADRVLVACTGWGQPDDRRRSQAAGFDHHLVKPVSADAVLQVAAALVQNRST